MKPGMGIAVSPQFPPEFFFGWTATKTPLLVGASLGLFGLGGLDGAIRVIGRVTESRLVPALPQGCSDWRIYIAGADSTGQGAAPIRFPTGSDLM